MARIAGINIPPQKHAEIGLPAIYGIGRTTAQKICDSCGIARDKKIKVLSIELESVEQVHKLAAVVKREKVGDAWTSAAHGTAVDELKFLGVRFHAPAHR